MLASSSSTRKYSNQIAENYLRPVINTYDGIIPTILEIPSKDTPYDLKKDSIAIKAARFLYGNESRLDD